jgi:hypothetical protein
MPAPRCRRNDPDGAGSEPEPAGIGDAPGVVAGDRERVAVLDRDHRSLMVGVKVTAQRRACRVVPEQRLVGAGAVGVGAEQCAGAVIFDRDVVAVVDEPGRARGCRDLPQPPERIVAERRRVPARSAHQPVFGVVDVGVRAVGGEVAVGVVGERR